MLSEDNPYQSPNATPARGSERVYLYVPDGWMETELVRQWRWGAAIGFVFGMPAGVVLWEVLLRLI